MAQIGTKGGNLDLLIRQGATQGPYYMTVNKADGTPLDITDAVVSAQIRKTADGPTLSGVTFTSTITSGTDGEFTWEIPADATALLTASPIDEEQPESQYVWDMEIELTSGRVIPLLYGIVKVFREVTKP